MRVVPLFADCRSDPFHIRDMTIKTVVSMHTRAIRFGIGIPYLLSNNIPYPASTK